MGRVAHRMRTVITLVMVAALLAAPSALAQEEPAAEAPTDSITSRVIMLPPLEVMATPFRVGSEAASFAVSYRQRSDVDLNTSPALTLDEVTRGIPGLFIDSREYYAVGDRVLVRGLGWRAQFGVRGIQVILDGIPLTMADGQSVLEAVDPSLIREIEVIRGPASTFWGNSSGGVVYISTDPTAEASHTARVRQVVGSYGQFKTDLQVSPNLGPHSLSVFTSYLTQDGYREHSETRLSRTGLTGNFVLGEGRGIQVYGAYSNMPLAESPSSLDAETAARDPRSARSFIVRQDVSKTSQQGQLGATYYDDLGIGTLRATGYGVFRTLDNPIPSGYIDLGRRAGGARLTLQDAFGDVEWGLGVEGKFQRDDRKEFDNEGGEKGAIQIDQLETVYNQAAFGRAALPVGNFRLSAGVRYDWLRFEADTRLSEGGDQGARTFSSFSPSVGLAYTVGTTRLFANVSTGLEAPTTTELGNRPDGQGGFNQNVGPENTLGFEAGVQGDRGRISYDVTGYVMRVDDLLLPFQLSADGPTFFRNSGETRHSGVEAAVQWQPVDEVVLATSYTYTQAEFIDAATADGEVLDGNEIPGVPTHVANGYIEWRGGPIWTTFTFDGVSEHFVNDANTAKNEGYAILGIQFSHPGFEVAPGIELFPFFAIDNLADTRHNDIIVNAFGGRYYEPSAGRTYQVGLSLQFD